MNYKEKLMLEFKSLSLSSQKKILLDYIDYVTDFPEEHTSSTGAVDGYPVSLWEWYGAEYLSKIENHICDECQDNPAIIEISGDYFCDNCYTNAYYNIL